MTFVGPGFLWLTLLVPLGLWVAHRHGAPAVRFAPAGFLTLPGASVPRSWRVHLLYLPATLQVVGLLLTVVALSRPIRIVPIPVSHQGIDIMLCIDTSSSMAANDLDPKRTRLDVAKEAARSFIRERPGDRVGVVGFARFPALLSPPTPDPEAPQALSQQFV